jgi:hypothetical protein
MIKVYSLRNKFLGNLLFYGFIIIYMLALFFLSYEVSIWEDECYTLNTTSRNFQEVITQSYSFEAQPPLYFILLKGWRFFNDSVLFARLFSVMFITLAAYFIKKLFDLISGPEGNRWLFVIFLLNPFTIWAAIEIRSYAMIIFLSTLSIYSFHQYLINDNKRYLCFFLAVTLLGIYTQYLFVFLILSLMFSLLVIRGWKVFQRVCIYLIPVVILFLPNILFISHDISIQKTTLFAWKSTIYLILQTPSNLLLGLSNISRNWKLVIIFFVGICSLFAYYKLYRSKKVIRIFEKINHILITIFFFIVLYAIGFSSFKILYADLYMAVAFPLLVLLITVFKIFKHSTMILIYSLFSLYFLYLFVINYKNPIKFYDFESITTYVEKIGKKNEPILFYRNGLSLPFQYYYNGINSLHPLPNPVTFDKDYLINIKDTLTLGDLIGRVSKEYILITDDKARFLYSLNMNRDMIDEYLNNNFRTTLDTLYYGRSNQYYLRIRRIEAK